MNRRLGAALRLLPVAEAESRQLEALLRGSGASEHDLPGFLTMSAYDLLD